MDIQKINAALQDLIIRLQDAEKGYKEILLATSIQPLKTWLERYSKERHDFHTQLESHVALLGSEAEVTTSFLGDLHRMFIDIKVNNTSVDNEFDAIVDEIERGSSTLLQDYDRVLREVKMLQTTRAVLQGQRAAIARELEQMKKLKRELDAVEA